MGINSSQFTVLISVVAIDLTLAVDNALVMGTIAAKLPDALRQKAILVGTLAAAFLRILFAIFASKLMGIFGLTLVGGMLLLWVSWKLKRELQHSSVEQKKGANEAVKPKTLFEAVLQILVADVSMSLDNTLAVAGTARNHFLIMGFGLALSVCLMAIAANLLASIVLRYRSISYIGLAIVLYSALSMIWEGTRTILGAA